jgi:hypothetical protein
MITVVAVASTGSPDVYLINLSAESPTPVPLPAFARGNVVDCYGSLLVIGDYGSGNVYVYSILNPAAPKLLYGGPVDTTLSSVSAISTDGVYVLAGGGGALVLVNVQDPNTPRVVLLTGSNSPQYGTALTNISSVVIRYPNALACGLNDGVTIDYSNPGSPIGCGIRTDIPSSANFSGQFTGDFDGTMAAIIAAGSSGAPNPPDAVVVFGISNGAVTPPMPPPLRCSTSTCSVAIAEIPEALPQESYYVATAQSGGPSSIQSIVGNNTSNPLQVPGPGGITPVAVKFLNNPAIAPFLAVANVTEQGYSVSAYRLITVASSDPSGWTIRIASSTPAVNAPVSSMENPTLGITAFEPPPPPWWKFLVPGWLLQWLQKIASRIIG